jgi:hypothetical protein
MRARAEGVLERQMQTNLSLAVITVLISRLLNLAELGSAGGKPHQAECSCNQVGATIWL